MAVQYICDHCGVTIEDGDQVTITTHQAKADELVVGHSCSACFEGLIEGDDAVASNLLLG